MATEPTTAALQRTILKTVETEHRIITRWRNEENFESLVDELHRGGFEVEFTDAESKTVTVRVSNKLLAKLILENNDPLKPPSKLSKEELLDLYEEAIKLLKRKAGIRLNSVWVMHDRVGLDLIAKEKIRTLKLQKVRFYYGTKISAYFGWLNFYCDRLYVPSFLGLLLFIQQIREGRFDTSLSPVFGVMLCIWSTLFTEFWKRKSSELSLAWGVFDVEEKERVKEMLERKNSGGKNSDHQGFRFALTSVLLLVIVVCIVWLMLHFMLLHKTASEMYDLTSPHRYYPLIVYSLLPVLSELTVDPLLVWMCDFEGYSSSVEKEDALIYKRFALVFVNRNCALLYTLFWQRDLGAVRLLLISLLTIGAIFNNVLEFLSPHLSLSWKKKKKAKKDPTVASADLSALELATEALVEALEHEQTLPEFDLSSDYMEMMVQFGYVILFSSALPLAPLFALLNNIFEFDLDIAKLCKFRRPERSNRASIGAWLHCLEIISFAGVITNVFVLCMLEDQMRDALLSLPLSALSYFVEGEYGRLHLFLLVEHVMIVLKLVMMVAVDDVPGWVQDAVMDKKIDEHELAVKDQKNRLVEKIDPISLQQRVAHTTAAEASHQKAAIARLAKIATSEFGFDPKTAIFIMGLPAFFNYLGLSWLLYLPVAVVSLLYLQAKKDRADRKAAIGIVTDSALLKLLYGPELPSWFSDSDVQRVEWLNDVLEKLWGPLSNAVEVIVMRVVQPILDKFKPAVLSTLELDHIDFGDVCPKITGVRAFTADQDSLSLDLDIKWAGDVEVLLRTGLVDVLLTDIRLSATVRVEALELMPTLPLVGRLNISLTKEPFLDFSLKFSSLDLMNAPGGSSSSSDSLIGGIIHKIVKDLLVYPKKLSFPLVKAGNNVSHPSAKGIVYVTVHSCSNLITADLLSSDPFVTVTVGDQTQKTIVQESNLNPVYNTTFEFVVVDHSLDVIKFEVWDYDTFGPPDAMGHVSVPVDGLPEKQTVNRRLDLADVAHGSVSVSLRYLALGVSDDVMAEISEVFDSIPPEVFEGNFIDKLAEVTSRLFETRARGGALSHRGVFLSTAKKHPGFSREDAYSAPPPVSLSSVSTSHHHHHHHDHTEIGVITISAVHCRGLRYSGSSVGDTLKAAVQFQQANSNRSTETIKGQTDPFFNSVMYIIVNDVSTNLVVSAVGKANMTDKEPTFIIGSVEVDLDEVVSRGMVSSEYQLSGGNNTAECFVSFRMSFQKAIM